MRPAILNPLFVAVSSLDGVGPKIEKLLTRLLTGREDGPPARVGDLMLHLPHSIIDRRHQPGIANAVEGAVVTLKVRVERHQPPPPGRSNVPYRVHVHDETGELALVFFHARAEWLEKMLPEGETRYVSGRIDWFGGRPNMVHPDHMVSETEFADLPLVEPVYPVTGGLSQKIAARSIRAALERLPDLPEWGEPRLLEREGWSSFNDALSRVHHPRDGLDIEPASPARRRLAYDELLAGQLALGLVRQSMKKRGGRARTAKGTLEAAIRAALPFSLTESQEQVLGEIRADLAKPERMLRLLQGDVGAGKTIVALLAMAAVVEDGSQAAIMAPTEILARQHFQAIAGLCDKAGITAELVTGGPKTKARQEIDQRLADGSIQIAVGTHALFQESVAFADLGLAVIDEQHRFGVHQRLAISAKGTATDIVVMTATPIPRTLVMTFFGDMDVSQLTGKPAGRRPVTTTAMAMDRMDELVARIGRAIERGEKLFWICPLVEDSEELPVTSVEERTASLSQTFGDAVGMVHGRMKTAEKDAAMDAFRGGAVKILVATTVVEVGVDVPDATIMVIEHAERFGLAQLHQLRGRVGRSDRPSSCVLLYKAPLGEIARARINIMRETDDGLKIAEEDLRLRGEGEVLGTRQSGAPGFTLASIVDHGDVLAMARDDARLLLETDPQLAGPRGEALRVLLYLFGRDQAVRLIRSG